MGTELTDGRAGTELAETAGTGTELTDGRAGTELAAGRAGTELAETAGMGTELTDGRAGTELTEGRAGTELAETAGTGTELTEGRAGTELAGDYLYLGRLFCQAPEVDGAAVISSGVALKPGVFIRGRVFARAGFDLEIQALDS
jgi:hypothetical protein